MEKLIYDEKNGLHYTLGEDGYYYPNLVLTEKKFNIGRFGRKHLDYLKKHKRVIYNELLSSRRLNEHLQIIDTRALEQYKLLIKQYAERSSLKPKIRWSGSAG